MPSGVVALCRVVVLETTDGPQRQRISKDQNRSQSSRTAERVIVNYRDEEQEHLLRTNDHEGAQC